MTVDQGNDHAKPYERGVEAGRAEMRAAIEQLLLTGSGADALREVRARAWDEGCTHHMTDPVACLMNPYRDTEEADDGD